MCNILSQLSLTASEAVHLLFRQIQLRRGLPFDMRIPNALTARTLRTSQAGKEVKRFSSRKKFYDDLGLRGPSAARRSPGEGYSAFAQRKKEGYH